jgi:pimeloyl-ACP methyl ester carboxylesterase
MPSEATPPLPRDLLARDLRLRLWDHGGEGPTVLFVHGYLDSGRSFDAVAARLFGKARALCLDLRGHGESEWAGAGGSYHLLDHLKDLACVINALAAAGELPELVVAHSMGGNVALLLAGCLPDAVRRLLLVDTLGPPPEDPEEQPERLARALEAYLQVRPFGTFKNLDDAIERLRALNPGLSREGARRMAAPILRPSDVDPSRLCFPLDPRLKGPTPTRWPEAMWLALCARTRAPVRVLRAEHGYVPEGELAAGRLQALRGSLRTLPGEHHHLHVDAPDELAAEVLCWLGVPTAAPPL